MKRFLNLKTSFFKGKYYERKAIKYLKKNKWHILKQNYKEKQGEIDIIAKKKNLVVAFEVKYREDLESLSYSILPRQQKRIQNAFTLFLKKHKKYYNYSLRFDAILIDGKNNIKHIENAWGER